ncbi:MAG: glycosyltransferase family A protein [Pseudomonadota bacterium]
MFENSSTKPVEEGLVSTIIPVYNRPEMVSEAIHSVLAQDYRPIEIIVVDDGSTDSTPRVLAELTDQYPELKVLSQQNAGPGVARQLGLESASGEFIQYLDSDDLLLPIKFTRQVEALRKQPECAVAYGKTTLKTSTDNDSNTALKRTGEKIETMFPAFIRSRWWSTHTPLYRHQHLQKIGPWLSLQNEEDWEYDCRVAALGTRLAFVDEYVSITRRHENHLSTGGGFDRAKLRDRCCAREHMSNSAQSSVIPIPQEDREFFSKSVFLLGRQCAAVGLNEEAEKMIQLSVNAAGAANYKHRIFRLAVKILGWRAAARLVTMINR